MSPPASRPLYRLLLLGLCVCLGLVSASPSAAGPGRTAGDSPPAFRPAARAASPADAAPVYTYRIVHTYPHDPQAFTQGLVYTNSVLYEGTGLYYGRSSLRRVDLETGQVLQMRSLSSKYFGEGIAVCDGKIFQLTYQENVAFVYDRDTFTQTGQFSYLGEGWGLTYDGQRLIMSDGTPTLYFRDPQTFSVTGQVQVHDGTTPIEDLNELEYIQGEVYANVWLTNRIARIDPATGQVTAWIDLAGLRPPGTDVLNGIAYDAENDRLFVTGKLWPSLFEIELCLRQMAYLPLVARGWSAAFPPATPTPTPTAIPGRLVPATREPVPGPD